MEVDPAPYKVILPNGTEMLVKKEVFEHFGTMMKMLEYTKHDKKEPILLSVGNVTPAYMKAFVDFYTIFDGVRHDSGMDAVARRLIPRNMQYNDSEEYREWVFILSDWDEIVAFLKVADQLEASEVIVFLVDRLREDLHTLPTKQLENRLAQLRGKKRKDPDTKERAQRLHYRRAFLIREILNASVQEGLERAVDRRIKKYINPMSTSPYITTIQQEPMSFVDEVYTTRTHMYDVEPDINREQLDEGKRRVTFSAMTTEIVTGLLFYALLNEDGVLNLFGSLWFNRDMTGLSGMMEPTKSLPLIDYRSTFYNCTGLWTPLTKDHYILIAKLEGLFVHSLESKVEPSTYMIEKIEGIEPDDLIDISCHASYAIILSRRGLFYWDARNNKVIEIEPPKDEVIQTFITLSYEMYVLTEAGHLYNAGIGFYETIQKEPQWKLTRYQVVIDHSFPTLFSFSNGQLVLLVNNELMRITSDPAARPVVTVSEIPFAGEGKILHLCSKSLGSYTMPLLLVETTTGLYIVKETEADMDYYDPLEPFSPVTRIGNSNTYKVLSIRVPEIIQKESEKKARLSISCQMCSAQGEWLHKATSVFCSHYCFHSSLHERKKKNDTNRI